jgi:hypothetical protein
MNSVEPKHHGPNGIARRDCGGCRRSDDDGSDDPASALATRFVVEAAVIRRRLYGRFAAAVGFADTHSADCGAARLFLAGRGAAQMNPFLLYLLLLKATTI